MLVVHYVQYAVWYLHDYLFIFISYLLSLCLSLYLFISLSLYLYVFISFSTIVVSISSKGDVSVLEDSMERLAAFWSSSAFDDLRDGGDKAADVLEHAIQRAADQIESDDNQLLKPSDVRVLVAVAEPKFSEFLVGRCTDKLELAHWEEVQERCDASAVKYQPSLSELHTAAADCLMIVTLGQVATACINTAHADGPTIAGLGLDAPVFDHFFEINSTKWMQRQCKGTSLDLVTKMAAEGKGFSQKELIATVNGVSKAAMIGFHSDLQHTFFIRAYADLSGSKNIPSNKKLFDGYNEELQLEADIMAGGGNISGLPRNIQTTVSRCTTSLPTRRHLLQARKQS